MNKKDTWLLTVLPNLLTDKTFETKYAAIVSCDDYRVRELRQKYKPVNDLLNSFIDSHLKKITPSCLIIHKKIYSHKEKHSAIVTFRNIIALSIILMNWSTKLLDKYSSPFSTLFSEYFDFFPSISYGDDIYIIGTPSLSSIISKSKRKHQINYLIPESNSLFLEYDDILLKALLFSWEDYFLNKNLHHSYFSLFRSLQMAFSACKMPMDNLMSIYDYGFNIALWNSSFEILFHKKDKGVGWKDIVDELNKFELFHNKLKKKIYTTENKSMNIIGLIYKELYDRRNDFFHGNKIEKNSLYLFNKKRFPVVTHIAHIIYLIALKVFLKEENVLPIMNKNNINDRLYYKIIQDNLEDTLLKIVDKRIDKQFILQ